MRILLTGATGFIGSALAQKLTSNGFEVVALVRDCTRAARKLPAKAKLVEWKSFDAAIDPAAFDRVDAVIHLVGEPIAEGRWTQKKKALLRSSRIESTKRLIEAATANKSKIKVFISASAVGYYGNRGDESLNESSRAGQDFLSQLTQDWERAAHEASAVAERVVCMRTGIVLGPGGGALAKMQMPFELGLGGRLGSGKQWLSWIHLDDLLALYSSAIKDECLSGAVNASAPQATRNKDFAAALAHVFGKRALLPVPSFALKLAVGELADALVSSQNVLPQKALACGFKFQHAELNEALRAIYGARK